MNLLVVILKKLDVVNEICKQLASSGVHGGTIIDAVGMASVLENMDDLPMFSMLRKLLVEDEGENAKTMLFVMDDEEMENAKTVIRSVVSLDSPNTGIMFALPVSFVEGI